MKKNEDLVRVVSVELFVILTSSSRSFCPFSVSFLSPFKISTNAPRVATTATVMRAVKTVRDLTPVTARGDSEALVQTALTLMNVHYKLTTVADLQRVLTRTDRLIAAA